MFGALPALTPVSCGPANVPLGPPFTHPTLPNFAHYVGATSPRSSPSHYLAAVQSLLQTYRLDIQLPMDSDLREDDRISNAIPLVVNTMGWTKGLGADLSRQIEEMVEPTHIYELEAPIFKPGWAVPPPVAHPFQDHMVRHAKKVNYSRLEPIPSSILSTNYSPADHRNLSILSYFHAIFPSTAFSIEPQQVTASSWNTTLPLCAQSPYEVNWSSACEKFILTGPGAEDVVSSEIEHVLNCAIVGLVSCEPGTIDVDIDSSSPKSTRTMPYVQGSPAPSPSSSNCHGIALIRALSPTSSHMHVLTPLPSRLIEKCKVLIKGELELPIWGMLDFGSQGDDVSNSVAGVEKGKVPYLQWGKGEGIGGERRRVRRNLMRRGQM
jgi:polynucleotide 5'-hydroxyl-kinase GRC3/NOL9